MNNWIGGISAAFNVTVTSPLTPVSSLHESSVTAGTAALLEEQRKHTEEGIRIWHIGILHNLFLKVRY